MPSFMPRTPTAPFFFSGIVDTSMRRKKSFSDCMISVSVLSAASGIIAGRALADRLSGRQPTELPNTTMLGALCNYISDPTVENFQPMASSMGILPGLDRVIKGKQERYAALAQRALSDLGKALSDSEDT